MLVQSPLRSLMLTLRSLSKLLDPPPSVLKVSARSRTPARSRGTGTRHGRGGLATGTRTTFALPTSEEPSNLATDIDPDISGPPRRSGQTAKPSRTILEEQEIQREVANTNTEQKARQIRRLEAAELVKEFLLKHGS